MQKRGSGKGCLVALVVLLAIVGSLVAGLVGLVSSVDNIDIGGGASGGTSTTVRPEPAKAAPKGLEPRSLMRAGNFAGALRQIEADGGGRVTSMRVAPERIDATLLTPAGRLRNVQIKPGGRLERLGPDSGAGFDQTQTLPLRRLSPTAPQRLTRAGAARLHVKASTVQYLVPTRFQGNVMWAAYFLHGRYVLGNASGRFQRAF